MAFFQYLQLHQSIIQERLQEFLLIYRSLFRQLPGRPLITQTLDLARWTLLAVADPLAKLGDFLSYGFAISPDLLKIGVNGVVSFIKLPEASLHVNRLTGGIEDRAEAW